MGIVARQDPKWFQGKVTMLFITHQIPRGLQVDEVIQLGIGEGREMKQMEVVEENNK